MKMQHILVYVVAKVLTTLGVLGAAAPTCMISNGACLGHPSLPSPSINGKK